MALAGVDIWRDAWWWLELQAQTQHAVFSATPDEFFDIMQWTLSRSTVAGAAIGISPRLTTALQERVTMIVARIPKAPLYTVVALGLLHALLGLVLTIVALSIRKDGVHETVLKMGIHGLVAERFEQSRVSKPAEDFNELFEEWDGKEGRRVGVEQAHLGGWILTSRSNGRREAEQLVERK
jgi:hypothetical protein